MITKKRSAGILLCLVLVWIAVFTMLRPASAEGTGTKEAPYEVGTWSGLNNLMDPSDFSADNRCQRNEECYIKLTGNITAEPGDTYLEVANGAVVILDLNGKTIDRGLKNKDAVYNGYVIKVMGNLTLDDTGNGGMITGGKNSSDLGGGIYVDSGSFTMNNGSISGNYAGNNSYGGGVFVSNEYSSFIMNGGTISDNFASYGAGVYVARMGSFEMKNGMISKNRGGVAGGGVHVAKNGSFTMNDGTISGNESGSREYPSNGGGVYVEGTFTMNNGTISDNNGNHGGGVYVEGGTFNMSSGTVSGNTSQREGGGVYVLHEDGTFNMSSGTVSGNTSQKEGGGVYVLNGAFNISGASVITGNQQGGTITDGTLSGGSVNNVYLPKGKYITVTGALDASASIGVTLEAETGRFTNTAETNIKNNDTEKFTSDNNEYEVGKFTAEAYPDIIQTDPKNDGQLFLGRPVTVTNIRAEDKEYDGNTNAKLDTSEAQFTDNHDNRITGLSVTAAGKFDNKDAGDAKTVNISDLSLTVPGEYLFLLASSGQQTTAQAKITPKPLTVTPDSGKGKTFGAADPELTWTQSGLVGGDPISGALSREAGENTGTYKITQGTLSAGGNYSINFTENVVFTIAKAGAQSLPDVSASVVFASGSAAAAAAGMPEDAGKLSYVLGEAGTTGSVTLTDRAVDAGGKVSVTFANGTAGDVITLPVTIRSENYEDSTVNVVFTLIEKEPNGFYFFRLDSELPGTGITVAGSADIKDVVSYRPVNMELLIPQLDLTSSIVSVPHTEEGYPVRELGNDAGLLEGFALPGSGISLIAGHNTLDAESFGPFAAIRLLEAGDRFFVRRDDGELLRFEVYANEKIGSADVEGLRQTAEVCEDSLTLLTCEDELPEGGYANRRIVSAKLIKGNADR